jgi:hypothetical protein
MVKIKQLLSFMVVMAIIGAMIGCTPKRVPQYTPGPNDRPMTAEEASAAKAKRAEEDAKAAEKVRQQLGQEKNMKSRPPMPTK